MSVRMAGATPQTFKALFILFFRVHSFCRHILNFPAYKRWPRLAHSVPASASLPQRRATLSHQCVYAFIEN